MKNLDELILAKRREIAELRKKKQALDLIKAHERKKNARPRGRPRLTNELIEKARELARTKTLPDVALRLGVALSSLYKHGIKRKILNAEDELKAKREATGET